MRYETPLQPGILWRDMLGNGAIGAMSREQERYLTQEQNGAQGPWSARKVVIVGAGAVGATFAYALAQSGAADDIALIDANPDLAKGQVLDLAHGLAFLPAVRIHVGSLADYRDADAIVITAGAKQQPGESRLALLSRNAAIVKEIARGIADADSPAAIIVTTNPVDILTYIVLKETGRAPGRVIGSGTVLDSFRFRYLLSQKCGVDVHNVHAFILGEHGDSEVAAWSMTHIAGIPIDEYCASCGRCGDREAQRKKIADEVRNSAYHVIDYKGATYFAIGLALTKIVAAVLRNQRSVLPVSTLLQGEYGLNDICLSVPCLVGRAGAERVIEGRLVDSELKALANSAAILKQTLAQIGKG